MSIEPNLTHSSVKITLVSLFDLNMAEIGRLTANRMREFAIRHAHNFVCFESLLDPDLHPSWNKLLAIRQVFQSNCPDWVLWIDADAIILNLDTQLEKLLDDRYDILFGSDFNGLCAGVMLLKHSEWTLRFLDVVLFLGDIGSDPDGFGYKAEQNAFKQLVHSFPSIGSHVKLLEQRKMNSYLQDYGNDDFILHLHSLPTNERVRIVREKTDHLHDSQGKGT